MTKDFRDYKTASKYASQINAGYSARLFDRERDSNPEPDEGRQQAWWYGWDAADASMRESAK